MLVLAALVVTFGTLMVQGASLPPSPVSSLTLGRLFHEVIGQ